MKMRPRHSLHSNGRDAKKMKKKKGEKSAAGAADDPCCRLCCWSQAWMMRWAGLLLVWIRYAANFCDRHRDGASLQTLM